MFFPKWKLELCCIIRTKSKRISVCILPKSGTHRCPFNWGAASVK